jgi:hypothetical protein
LLKDSKIRRQARFFLPLPARHGRRLLHRDEFSGVTPSGIVHIAPEQHGIKKANLVKKYLPEKLLPN